MGFGDSSGTFRLAGGGSPSQSNINALRCICSADSAREALHGLQLCPWLDVPSLALGNWCKAICGVLHMRVIIQRLASRLQFSLSPKFVCGLPFRSHE